MPTPKCALLEVYLLDILLEWTLVEKSRAFSRNGEPPVASADTPLGQWFSNYFDHDPKKEKTQYSNETYSYFL